ncbi:oxidoreductase [Rhizobium leguminosarum]|jgi:scyllo-inositol 2-dehydrogenase (NADP+)|uniref:oxidoreductase n=1 Tax=Rhizobium leguminosarum TaxID=384 RepID=UPI0010316E33|nr:oxidoreductase [Rhizobium leguminosarum]TAV90181.1 oxidoreductase [Rhizobium leguminosarum]TAV94788.1 oxidoreductase [Rhizobium leguminosarum]TAW35865.1 oxidoreductase [Rhizobium leguminosarum]TAX30673.1 oxidoreductase [Rhizobium leguminosarum]TAY33486.1 oxidoreductase [Rhizobium leguminosarum]
MSHINVGLIGFGLAGSVFHAPLISSERRMKLSAIATSRSLPPEFATAKTVRDPYELVASKDVDLVVIATPNEAHVPLATAALNAGKHVVVDKPFTIELADAKSLAALAAEKGRILSVFQNRRWDGNFLTVRKLLAENAVGNVNFCEIHFDRFRPVANQGWREAADAGSGVLYDLGSHVIDQAFCLFGMPDAVIADVTAQRENVVADDYFHIQLIYGQKLRVILHACCIALHEGPRIVVHGDKGSIVQSGLDGQEAALIEGLRPSQQGWGVTKEISVFVETETGRKNVDVEPGAYEAYYHSVAAAILDGKNPDVTPQQAVNVMTILDAALRSSRQTRRIELS